MLSMKGMIEEFGVDVQFVEMKKYDEYEMCNDNTHFQIEF